ncbi:methyltransferase domain-containing protein [Leptolyngbya sp. FACHB-711]|uniref:class I SAM-dependent methyltransferase n=1 Tax=unclassified Leptolyngbya TaxID=2650499 RepID=UPI001689F84D|nr:methyltransferase domain-containing protein [Leptolyngbya sp. FACHB-711]MBD2027066.1 methyltransferase [Leptolyngbya sp. FACHB-711]
MMDQEIYLKRLYANRFDVRQRKAKEALWKVLIDDFIQRYISPHAIVLDIGGGYCEFINQVKAREKVLIDLNPDSQEFAAPNVKVLHVNILAPESDRLVPRDYFDVIFVSNFFEHLQTKEELIEVLSFCFNRLSSKGKLIVVQPNFKYSFKEYYDFIDHHLPITDGSLNEVLKAIGFSVDLMIPRFLPFSTKGRPSAPLLLQIYLKLPILWRFLGGQMFVIASKPY